jgi:hypothetical protein
LTVARAKRSAVPRGNQDKVDVQTAEANALTQEFLDREASGLDPIPGWRTGERPTIPWVRGDKETWILTLIADCERYFRETGNASFILAAYDVSAYLPDRAIHKDVLAWVHIGLHLVVRQLLAGNNPLTGQRGKRSLLRQAQKRLRDSALALKVWNRLPIERGDETWAIAHFAAAEELSITVVGDAWRLLKTAATNLDSIRHFGELPNSAK